MESGKIIIINGTSRSGKTSIVHALQELLEAPLIEAGIDKFIFMMPERYLERPLWDDVLSLATRAGESGHTLFAGMHQAIRVLSLAGVNVIADHVLVEPGWAGQCTGLFADLPAYLVGVKCPLEVLEERERSRKNRTLGQARAQYEIIHKHVVYDKQVDTSRLSPAESARKVCSRLSEPPAAFRRMAQRVPLGGML
jgi:chloramphenicol 3-O phosphotransferase